jgi:hypothetical protein
VLCEDTGGAAFSPGFFIAMSVLSLAKKEALEDSFNW